MPTSITRYTFENYESHRNGDYIIETPRLKRIKERAKNKTKEKQVNHQVLQYLAFQFMCCLEQIRLEK